MSVETNPHNYTNMKNTFSQFFMPARISPKENSGARKGLCFYPLTLSRVCLFLSILGSLIISSQCFSIASASSTSILDVKLINTYV